MLRLVDLRPRTSLSAHHFLSGSFCSMVFDLDSSTGLADLFKELLGVASNLWSTTGLDVLLDFLPVLAVNFEGYNYWSNILKSTYLQGTFHVPLWSTGPSSHHRHL